MLPSLPSQLPAAVRKATSAAQPRKLRLLLIDSHPILRESFASFISREMDLDVCGQTADPSAALEQLGTLQPQLVIVDISLDGENGIDFVKKLHHDFPQVNILVFSHQDEALYAERALRAGAK